MPTKYRGMNVIHQSKHSWPFFARQKNDGARSVVFPMKSLADILLTARFFPALMSLPAGVRGGNSAIELWKHNQRIHD